MNLTQLKGLILLPLFLFGAILPPEPEFRAGVNPPDTFVVVLDAGHGGHDPGNLGNGYLEKNIALEIVLAAGAELSQNKDIKVVYTREDDSFVDLYKRGEIANKANADIFVSVHCDAFKSSDPNGAGTFVLGLHANQQNFEIAKKENSVIYLEDDYETRYSEYDINSPESIIGLTIMQEEFLEKSIALARFVQTNFSGKLKRKDRQVKQAGFIVLHQTFMPSVLIETGFLTNRNEGAYLNSKKGQREMGKAIADAIISYKNEIVPKAILEYDESEFAEAPSTAPPVVKKEKTETQPAKDVPADETKIVQKQPDPETRAIEKELNTPTTIEKKEPEKPVDTGAEVISEKIPPKEETKPEKQVVKEDKQTGTVTETQTESKKPESKTSPVVSTKKSTIEYRVQIMASARKLTLESENFRGLNNLTREPYKNLFRYMYGKTPSYEQVKLFKANADAKGYTTSYIVAYKDGQRIGVKEALAYQEEE